MVTIDWKQEPRGPGADPVDVLVLVSQRLEELNSEIPNYYTELALFRVEEAIMWLDERTNDRIRRKVEGTKKP